MHKSQHVARYMCCLISPHNNPMRWILLFAVNRQGNEGLERLSNMPRGTASTGGRDQIGIWLQSLALNHCTAPPSCCHRPEYGSQAREAKWLSPIGTEEPSNVAEVDSISLYFRNTLGGSVGASGGEWGELGIV